MPGASGRHLAGGGWLGNAGHGGGVLLTSQIVCMHVVRVGFYLATYISFDFICHGEKMQMGCGKQFCGVQGRKQVDIDMFWVDRRTQFVAHHPERTDASIG